MAEGNIVDVGALGKAGFASKDKASEARIQRANEKQQFWEGVTRTAYTALGNAAIGQVKQSFQNLQNFRDQSDSQTAALNLKIDKMPKENVHLEGSIVELNKRYRKAARQASLGFGKKRAKGRQDMERYMKQLQDMNGFLETYKTNAETSQGMARVLSGVAGENNQGGFKNINPGTNGYELNNTLEQANGLMGKNLRWNIDTGQMMVLRNGVWKKDENGNDIYTNKVATGTYEEYAKDYEGMQDKEGKAVEPMSIEDWTEANQQNQGLMSEVLYSDLKFGKEEDNTMETDALEFKQMLTKGAWKENAQPWSIIEADQKQGFMGKVMSYNDDQFKDFYFGGYSYDYSTNRMTESAPAYQRLKEQDRINGNLNSDGNGWQEGYGPGSANWEGRLLALKGQSFVKGSFYRKEATDKIFQGFKDQYEDNAAAYKTDNPIEDKDTSTTWNTSYGNISKVRANLFVNKVENGAKTIKDLRGYDGKTYTWDLQSDGTYLALDGEEKFIRTKEEMLIQNELESFYPDVFKGFSQAAAKKNMPDANNDGKSDFIVPLDYKTYVPKEKDEEIIYRYYNSNDAKKGIGIDGKYNEDKENGVRYKFIEGEYVKLK